MSRQVRSVSTETCAIAKLGRYIPVATSKIYRAFIKVLQFEIAFNTTGSLHQTAGACRPSRCPLLALSGSMEDGRRTRPRLPCDVSNIYRGRLSKIAV
jgi:hypothetical protein